MSSKIWFISDDGTPIAVFDDKQFAQEEYGYLREEGDGSYDLYYVELDDLEDYPEEYDLALESGMLDG